MRNARSGKRTWMFHEITRSVPTWAMSLHSGITVSWVRLILVSHWELESWKLTAISSQSQISHSVQLGNGWLERYKRCWMVHYFNPQFPSQLESKNTQKLLFKMIEINATRIPNSYYPGRPHVGDDANHILTRGERWPQHPSNDVPIVLMCCVLASVKYLVRRLSTPIDTRRCRHLTSWCLYKAIVLT